MPGGQAGNPFTPYYGRGHAQWQQGVPMPLLPQQIEYRLRLVPARGA
jgi:penicillin amidase